MYDPATVAPSLSRRALLRGSAMLGGTLVLPGLAFAQGTATASRWPALEAMMRGYVADGKVANMVAALGWGQQEPEFLAFGDTSFTSGVTAGPDTLYRIYSMTKPLTGMATMLLIEEGALSLDQPIAEVLPAFAGMQVQKQYDGAITPDNLEPAARPITVRHCLTHTAGLGYSIVQSGPLSEYYDANGIVPGQVTRLQLPTMSRATPAPSLAEFADRLAAAPLVYQPGTRWSYSVGLDLLGRVIEVVSGQPFDAFLKNRFFDPIGMSSTYFRVPASERERLTANYFVAGGQLVPVDLPADSIYLDAPPFPFGGAGLVSTARDYDRFLRMILGWGRIDGTRVMAEPTVRLATSNLLPGTLEADGGFKYGEQQFGYGAGGLVGRGIADGLYGWFGAAGTGGLVNMKMGLRHTLMTQYMPSEAYPIYSQFPLTVAQDAMAQLSAR